MLNFDDLWFNQTILMAKKSKDPRTQVGAVIVNQESQTLISAGYNGPPRGWDDTELEKQFKDKSYKNLVCEHAERNAIFNAAKNGAKTDKCVIYTTLAPCNECARAIHQAGIREILVPLQFSTKISDMSIVLFKLKGKYIEKIQINWQFDSILIDGKEEPLIKVA